MSRLTRSVHSEVDQENWRLFFANLISDDDFKWGRKVHKWDGRLNAATTDFTMKNIAEAVMFMPSQFTARGVEFNGGIYNKPFPEGFCFEEVEDTIKKSTVVLLNAGYCVPSVSVISQAALEATSVRNSAYAFHV